MNNKVIHYQLYRFLAVYCMSEDGVDEEVLVSVG
jgi:hypothetical protein